VLPEREVSLASSVRKVVDTVALVAFVDTKHPMHATAKKHVESLSSESDVFLPSTSLLELDLVLKGSEFKLEQRKDIFGLLAQVIPDQKILPLTTRVIEKAVDLDKKARWTSHYFDAIIAAYAINHSATIVTTDRMIPPLGVTTEW
jgi:predicted nucleic acid-binding protein